MGTRPGESSDEIKALEKAIVETAFKVNPTTAEVRQQRTHSERLRVLRESLSSSGSDPVPRVRADVDTVIQHESPPEREGPLQAPNWGYMQEYKNRQRRIS